MDDEAQALKAGNGWRVHGSHGEYTFWRRTQSMWGKESVGYNVTKGEVPDETRGSYGTVAAIASMKGIRPDAVVLAEGARADVRAVRAPDFDGKPTWHGLYRTGETWETAGNEAGEPIAYASPDAARDGAMVCLEDAPAAGPGPR